MLHRPYIRKDVVQEVEDNAPRSEDGRFLDANTGEPIDGKYDLGHKPGHEFRKERHKAEDEGLTQEEFNERMNDPSLYQIEDPSSNRSHKYEAPDEDETMSGIAPAEPVAEDKGESMADLLPAESATSQSTRNPAQENEENHDNTIGM